MMIVSKYRYLLVGLASLLCLCQHVAAEEGAKAEFLNSNTAMTWDDRFDQLGLNGPSLALAANGIDIYVGGSFTMAGVLSVNNIAKWDGTSWSVLGTAENNGVNGLVNAMAMSGSDLYVGGDFSSAGGVSVNNIAKWDGATWSALGGGITGGDVRTIAIAANGDVYTGGFFTTAGGINANNVAKWDGTNWSALGSGSDNGVNSLVSTISVENDSVYVGGSFSQAGSQSVNNIAMWNDSNSSWNALGGGVTSGTVNSIISTSSALYVGGQFTAAGGISAKKVATWDGNNWSAIGNGLAGGDVNTMVVNGSDLFVAGSFNFAGSDSAQKIAKWNGSDWSALGSGIEGGPIFSISMGFGDVYVGGSFNTAGGNVSDKFARWIESDGTVPVELASFTATLDENEANLLWITATETNNYGFELERKIITSTNEADSQRQWEKIAFVNGHGTTTQTHKYTFQDNLQTLSNFSLIQTLFYRLKQIDQDGSFTFHGPLELAFESTIPENIELEQNYPNPFNPETKITFVLPTSGFTTLEIYNELGQKVKTLMNENLQAGQKYEVNFSASGLSSGIYYYSLQVGGRVKTKRMTLIK